MNALIKSLRIEQSCAEHGLINFGHTLEMVINACFNI